MADDIFQLGGTYDTGTLTATNGSKNVTVTGALLTTQAIKGDWLWVPSAKCMAFIDSVTDDENLVLSDNWTADTQTDVSYLLIKMSWSRYDPAATQAKIREMLAYLEGIGIFYFVTGDAPDPRLGKEGQWGLKVNAGAWKLWYYTNGEWVLQGDPVGVSVSESWNNEDTFELGAIVGWQGKLWRSLIANNVGNQPDLSPTSWAVWLSGGDRYDIAFFDTDRPASNELIAKLAPVGVTFPVGLTESYATAEVGAEAEAIYIFKKNGTQFATLTFSTGNLVGVFNCPTETTFAHADVFEMWAPVTRDPTLSGVGGNLIGYRNIGV